MKTTDTRTAAITKRITKRAGAIEEAFLGITDDKRPKSREVEEAKAAAKAAKAAKALKAAKAAKADAEADDADAKAAAEQDADYLKAEAAGLVWQLPETDLTAADEAAWERAVKTAAADGGFNAAVALEALPTKASMTDALAEVRAGKTGGSWMAAVTALVIEGSLAGLRQTTKQVLRDLCTETGNKRGIEGGKRACTKLGIEGAPAATSATTDKATKPTKATKPSNDPVAAFRTHLYRLSLTSAVAIIEALREELASEVEAAEKATAGE